MAALDWFAPDGRCRAASRAAAAPAARRAAARKRPRTLRAARHGRDRLDGRVRAAAHRRRRHERRRSAREHAGRPARQAAGRSSRRRTRRSPPRSRPPAPPRGSRRPRTSSASCPPTRGGHELHRPRPEVGAVTRVVNSRIRLLLLLVFLAFAALLARAAWIQTVRAASLAATRAGADEDVGRAARRPRHDLRPARLAARARRAGDDGLRRPARGDPPAAEARDGRAHPRPEREATCSARSPTAARTSSTSRARRPPTGRALLAKKSLPGFRFYARGAPRLPAAARSPRRCSAMRASTTRGLPGSSSRSTAQLAGQPGQETVVARPARPRDRRPERAARARTGTTSSSRSTTRSRRRPSRCSGRPSHQWQARSDATAIVLDPRTGGVLAMAMEPGYDANRFPAAEAKGLQANHAVTDVFEPGSVFKVVTVARRALRGARHAADGRSRCRTRSRSPTARSTTRSRAAPRRLTVAQILQHSSNVGAVTIAEKLLGETRLEKWIGRFGFGEKTGIDFPGESPGLLPSYWSGSTIGNVPIGQGISVTRDPARVRVRGDRERRRRGSSRTSSTTSQGEQPPEPKRRRIVSPRSTASC